MPMGDRYGAAPKKQLSSKGMPPQELQSLLAQGYTSYDDGAVIPPMGAMPGANQGGGPGAGATPDVASGLFQNMYEMQNMPPMLPGISQSRMAGEPPFFLQGPQMPAMPDLGATGQTPGMDRMRRRMPGPASRMGGAPPRGGPQMPQRGY